jgi:hypothetical protein
VAGGTGSVHVGKLQQEARRIDRRKFGTGACFSSAIPRAWGHGNDAITTNGKEKTSSLINLYRIKLFYVNKNFEPRKPLRARGSGKASEYHAIDAGFQSLHLEIDKQAYL